MSFIQAIILGFVQGLTEFLPVSSSGHLALVQSIFENFEQPGLLYDTMLHLATLFAVMIYFRKRITCLFYGFLGFFFMRYRVNYFSEKSMLHGIIIATIPTGIIGFLLKDVAESFFEKPVIVGYFLIITSLLLYFSDKRKSSRGVITPVGAFFVGIVQGLAVFPGISRSGSTIFAGLNVNIPRETAAEFSFLISIPAILGATILQLRHFDMVNYSYFGIYIAGMFVAFITGLAAISIMMYFVRNTKLKFFALYCLIIGICAVIFL